MSTRPNKSAAKWIITITLVLLISALVHYVILFPYSVKSTKLPFQQAQFSLITQQVRQGVLKPDAQGTVTLPSDLAAATINGKVYVTHASNGLLIVFFPTWWGQNWYGRRIDYTGYVYCSRPLAPTDKNSLWTTGDTISLNGPSIDAYRKPPKAWSVIEANWYFDKGINPHWYSVISDDNEI